MSHVFPRVMNRALPTAVSAEGSWITDADGKRYLDGAGGAIVTWDTALDIYAQRVNAGGGAQ